MSAKAYTGIDGMASAQFHARLEKCVIPLTVSPRRPD